MSAISVRMLFGYGTLLVHAVSRRRLLGLAEVRVALVRQIHVTGVQALPYVAIVGLLFGAVVVTRAFALLGPDDETVLEALVWGGIRELGPLITALIIVARSGVAIAAEVGLMKLRPGIHDDYWRDIDHEEEVVLPRLLGTALASAALVSLFQVIAICAALAASSFTLGTAVAFELDSFLTTAGTFQVPLSVAKGALFGLGIGAISCYHGLQVVDDVGELPKAVVAACVGSLTFIGIIDLLAMLIELQ